MWRYYHKGWWCPRHPWPPAWARPYTPYYMEDVESEIRYLERLKRDLEIELEEISKRIDELRKMLEEKKG
ncbi:MAG: DUF5320 domain-containing protein [Nitrososphaeria archaeon]|nr:DUF5320 domain-containing protein [Nitrososphaeria archaeon]